MGSGTGLLWRSGRLVGELHFVGGGEALLFIDGAALAGGVERGDADIVAAGLIEADLDQLPSQSAAAIVRIDEDVEDVAALRGGGIARVRRPVQDEQAGGGDGSGVGGDDPPGIAAVGETGKEPRLEVAGHLVERAAVRGAHPLEHGATMGGDQGCVRRGGEAGFEHEAIITPRRGRSFARLRRVDPVCGFYGLE